MHYKSFIHRITLSTLAFVIAFGLLVFMPAVRTEAAAAPEALSTNTPSNYDRWMGVCDQMLRNLKKYKFRYGNHGTKGTFAQAVNSKRRTNCALYVSWCLQQYGVTQPGDRFYVKGSGKMKKNFRWDSSKVSVYRVYRRCSSTKLQPGDVVCWSGSAHANIYAGKSASGEKLWYDGGKVATRGNRNGARYTKTGKKALGYLNHRKISYIVRIKDLAN